jgi:ubiquinone/menaquinone biosynthesis C-methylase UbiE
MLMNWPERVWIHSPVRRFVQALEVKTWLSLCGRRKVHLALEIGCGAGRGAQMVARMMGYETIVAFDLEERLVRKSIRNRPRALAERLEFFVGDAQDLPFPDVCFDAVINFGIIHHVIDWRRCIRELGRVTKRGGLFCFEEIFPALYANALLGRMLRHPTQDRFDEKAFLEELRRNDFRLLPQVRTGSKYRIIGVAEKIPE